MKRSDVMQGDNDCAAVVERAQLSNGSNYIVEPGLDRALKAVYSTSVGSCDAREDCTNYGLEPMAQVEHVLPFDNRARSTAAARSLMRVSGA
jgi:hypothetical protein